MTACLSLPPTTNQSSDVFVQFKAWMISILVWMATPQLTSTDCKPYWFSHLMFQMHRVPSLQTEASLSPMTLLNWTSQTWSLCALRLAMQVWGITSVEQLWLESRLNLSMCMLWYRHYYSWKVKACCTIVSRRFGCIMDSDWSTCYTFSIKCLRPLLLGPLHHDACFCNSVKFKYSPSKRLTSFSMCWLIVSSPSS